MHQWFIMPLWSTPQHTTHHQSPCTMHHPSLSTTHHYQRKYGTHGENIMEMSDHIIGVMQ